MEDKVTLDRKAFKSLASQTRVDILKSLDSRRKMLTELSREMGMTPSTVKEHMDNLCNAGLAVQMDEGRKWKYYELTKKGRDILHPGETKIWILLSVSILAMAGITYDMLGRVFETLFGFAKQAEALARAPLAATEAGPLAGTADAASQALTQIPYYHVAGLIVFAVIFGASMTYLALSRKRLLLRV